MGNPHPLIWEVPLEAPQHALRLEGKLLVLPIPPAARRDARVNPLKNQCETCLESVVIGVSFR